MVNCVTCYASKMRQRSFAPRICYNFEMQRNEGCEYSSSRDVGDGFKYKKKHLEIWIGAERCLCKVANWKKGDMRIQIQLSWSKLSNFFENRERRHDLVKQLP